MIPGDLDTLNDAITIEVVPHFSLADELLVLDQALDANLGVFLALSHLDNCSRASLLIFFLELGGESSPIFLSL